MRWVEAHDDEEDIAYFFELDAECCARRQVELHGADRAPAVAAALAELPDATVRDCRRPGLRGPSPKRPWISVARSSAARSRPSGDAHAHRSSEPEASFVEPAQDHAVAGYSARDGVSASAVDDRASRRTARTKNLGEIEPTVALHRRAPRRMRAESRYRITPSPNGPSTPDATTAQRKSAPSGPPGSTTRSRTWSARRSSRTRCGSCGRRCGTRARVSGAAVGGHAAPESRRF